MRLSYVLRLVPDELADGHLVGEVESVLDGAMGAVHSSEDLVAFCREHARLPDGEHGTAPGGVAEERR